MKYRDLLRKIDSLTEENNTLARELEQVRGSESAMAKRLDKLQYYQNCPRDLHDRD
jgi:hypothetical protein